ncbi:nucleotide exchange factor GrpE [Sporolactobacillus vineae]|uniref:nucleotide exchange factor GrpE n=1 Tax=Sporolactobacillus vineae TaxID=444463 RepID=UPI000289D991|nr:nucleotide exchange factor GrpE [Sporolactobacillus vineae]
MAKKTEEEKPDTVEEAKENTEQVKEGSGEKEVSEPENTGAQKPADAQTKENVQPDQKPADENHPDVAALTKKISDQESEIETLKKNGQELNSRWLRTQADFDNFRKRTIKERADARKYRSQDLVTDLLEPLDNFKRALSVETATEEGASLKKGMEMVMKRLEEALKKEGVEEIPALGKPFDPKVHQAVMQEKSEDHDSGTVIQVLQAGYQLNGRVIRPAMVKVSA